MNIITEEGTQGYSNANGDDDEVLHADPTCICLCLPVMLYLVQGSLGLLDLGAQDLVRVGASNWEGGRKEGRTALG